MQIAVLAPGKPKILLRSRKHNIFGVTKTVIDTWQALGHHYCCIKHLSSLLGQAKMSVKRWGDRTRSFDGKKRA